MSSDIFDSLKNLLGDDAEDKIRSVLSSLGGDAPPPPEKPEQGAPQGLPSITPETLEYISLFKSIAEGLNCEDDSRSELLKSLRPFMRSERQQSIDTAIKLLKLSKFSGLLNI